MASYYALRRYVVAARVRRCSLNRSCCEATWAFMDIISQVVSLSLGNVI